CPEVSAGCFCPKNRSSKIIKVEFIGLSRNRGDTECLKNGYLTESGIIDLELVKELGTYQRYKIGKDGEEDRAELKTIIMFLFKTNQNLLRPVDAENPEARWIEKDNVADLLTHPKDKEFFSRIEKEI
ncbi:MAG: hypothetical protein HY454_01555, partial [Parcubacteria group bacterium]|nr:hypothetical protein [Parcubacteria group bacterium]